MRSPRFHGLKRLKIRQTWNKYNLYNLSRLRRPQIKSGTHFQQKWQAKSASRGYHGEQIREKAWQRQFSPRIRSVVPMNHKYLAAFDGSEQAEGRGSGRDLPGGAPKQALEQTPYMQMTYAPMERRLDTAIFRALFASSTRQARQFVVHGAVKVNGKKIIYPGYNLNPGDMFQVDPERVLFATGAPKDAQERRATRVIRKRAQAAKDIKDSAANTAEVTVESTGEEVVEANAIPSSDADANVINDEEAIEAKRQESKVELKDLMEKAKSILATNNKNTKPSAKRKQELRAFTATVRKAIGKVKQKSIKSLDDTVSSLDGELDTLLSHLSVSSSTQSKQTPNPTSTSPAQGLLAKEDKKALREALERIRDNPIDSSKPYATPWRPRPYMSAFAFIPRYLEVNQNICSAVYLRHPVARPGLAEVPTPFTHETNQLAFTWYLRRR